MNVLWTAIDVVAGLAGAGGVAAFLLAALLEPGPHADALTQGSHVGFAIAAVAFAVGMLRSRAGH